MKQDRDMFYSDYNYGGYVTPNPYMNMMGPNMYQQNTNMISSPNMFNANSNMMAAGPNVVLPNTPNMNINTNENVDNYESRISKLERDVKKLESRVNKLESEINPSTDIEVNSSMYMI